MEKSVLTSKKYYDERQATSDEGFEVNDTVLYRDHAGIVGEPRSFSSWYLKAVYVIVKRISNNYFIRLRDDEEDIPKCVHFNQLKRYVPRTDERARTIQTRTQTDRPKRLGYEFEAVEEKTVR